MQIINFLKANKNSLFFILLLLTIDFSVFKIAINAFKYKEIGYINLPLKQARTLAIFSSIFVVILTIATIWTIYLFFANPNFFFQQNGI